MFGRLLKFFDTLRRTLAALLLLAVIGMLGAALLSSRPSVPDGALLVIDPAGRLVEELDEAPSFPAGLSAAAETRVGDVIRALRASGKDKRIRTVLLDLQDMDGASLPALQSIGREIDRLRAGGKQVLAYADHYSQSQYLLAAHASELWLHPMGMVLLTGLSSYRNYVADALARMHVNIHLFRAGTYKSAAEPLVRNDMSPAAREETTALLGQLWQVCKQNIQASRKIAPEDIQAMLDDPRTALARYDGDPAKLALAMRLVSHIGTRGDLMHKLAMGSGGNEPPVIDLADYLRTLPPEDRESGNSVGILTASGTLSDGQLVPGGVDGESFSKLVDRATDDPSIKAVVLRIDSPGGSVQASETIRAALIRLKQSGKPLVVSMAGMAASGGYWIAAGADEIWAQPTTITGSIGVFGIFPDVSGGLESLGIHTDGTGTTALAGGLRPDRPLPPAVADVLQAGVDHVYARFKQIVAEGRHLQPAQVEAIAEGRVWSGTDAQRIGLVDQLGGLDQAVAAAAKRAGLNEGYGTVHVRPRPSLRDWLMQRFLGDAEAAMIRMAGLGQVRTLLDHSAGWLGMLRPAGGIYAYCGLSTD